MADNSPRALRREFIGIGLTGAMVGLAGCSDSVNIETEESDDSTDEESEEESNRNVNIDTASFNFSYDDDAQQVAIEFTAGNSIRAGNVRVQQVDGKSILWAELGSTTAGPDENIEVGDTAVLGPSIFNWETPISSEDTIRLMYTGKETPATLQRYSPPEPSGGTSTVPASISGFTLENSAEQQLQVSFDSSKQLGSIEVDVSGAESATLSRSDFTESASGDESFEYSATYSASSDGTYTATLAQTADTSGTNALNGENISATASINTEEQSSDTTPPSISAFSIANPSEREIRMSFDSTEELASIRVDISGPESTTLAAADFNQSTAADEGATYQATYQAETEGDYTATLVEATDSAGNDGASGAEVSVAIEDSTASGGQTLIEDDFESNHDMEPYQIDTGASNASDRGTIQVDAPDGGDYVGWLSESDSGNGTIQTAISKETIDWNTSHEFDFLVRCPEYTQGSDWNKVIITWRGRKKTYNEGTADTLLRLQLFNTTGSGDSKAFRIVGPGVVESQKEYDIEWEPSTWYQIRGYLDQQDGRVEAKIWKDSESEPDEYQASATVSTEPANDLPYSVSVTGDNQTTIRCELAHLRWSEL